MYLVDTSVWIDYIQGRDARQVSFLDDLLKNPLAVGVTDVIYMEILQAAKDQKTFDMLRSYFSGQQFYRFSDPELSHASAAQIYFDCCRQGVTVRSTMDCLIAQCAIEHELTLLHHDRDFKHLASVVSAFRHQHFLE
jgi:predicted nucleic acid-binding protein